MKRLILSVMAVLLGMTVSAQNMQKVYPVDSAIHTGIKALYMEAGIAPPSSSGPWSAAELRDMLQRLSGLQLSEQGAQLYGRLNDALDIRDMTDRTVQGSIGFNPTIELYLHSNDSDYRLDTDWLYDYDKRRAFVDIPIETFLTDYIYNLTTLAMLKTRFTYNDLTGEINSSEVFSPLVTSNFPFGEALVNHVDLNFPERAVIGIGFDRLNLTLGRDDLKWGSGRTGSLTVGDHLDYYDFLKFTSFHKNFKYTWLVAGFDSPVWDGQQNSFLELYDEAELILDGDGKIIGVRPLNRSDNLKMYVAHRFEFRFLRDRARFALTEAMIYQTSTLDFRYLNPAMFYHNLFIRANANSTLTFELDINPFRNINIYASLLVDEFPYPGEDQTAPWAHPTGIGQQYGVETTWPVGPGHLTGWAEYVRTDPLLYLRDKVEYIVHRRVFSMERGISVDRNYLGYQYGNDVIMLAGGVGYDWFDYLAASLSILYKQHGENDMDSTWGIGPAYVNQVTPYIDPNSGKAVEKALMVSANVKVTPLRQSAIKPLRNLELMTQLDFISHRNKDNVSGKDTSDLQWTLGLGWQL
jgi:hypothetical protein